MTDLEILKIWLAKLDLDHTEYEPTYDSSLINVDFRGSGYSEIGFSFKKDGSIANIWASD